MYRTVIKEERKQLSIQKKSLKGHVIHVFTRPKDKIEDLQTNRMNVRYNRELYLQGNEY